MARYPRAQRLTKDIVCSRSAREPLAAVADDSTRNAEGAQPRGMARQPTGSTSDGKRDTRCEVVKEQPLAGCCAASSADGALRGNVANQPHPESARELPDVERQRLPSVHWRALHRALEFVAAAERDATPVYAGIAGAAAAVSIAFWLTVHVVFLLVAVPLTIVAAALMGGALVRYWLR